MIRPAASLSNLNRYIYTKSTGYSGYLVTSP
nr:MAG TPA: hypothetical protein [Caudoviricetes sp.]